MRTGDHLRTCSQCGARLPLDGFYRDAKGRDGRQSACKDCHRERVRASRARHRERNRREGVRVSTKRCGRCGAVRRATAFHRNASTPDGLHWTCRECASDPAARRDAERRRTIRAYDLTREEFDELRRLQEDCCAICRQAFAATPHIDHDHASGVVRGLLCRSCNIGLGLFDDDVDRLRDAITYLEDAR